MPALALAALIAVLGSAWIADFRYQGDRGHAGLWAPQVLWWERACQSSTTGTISVSYIGWGAGRVPCDRLRF